MFGLRGGAGAKLRPGDRVAASASFGKAQLFCDAVKSVGHDDQLELEGIYLSTEDGVLSLAVHGRGLVKVSVPDGFDLPVLNPGDEVSLQATVESDGTFTLVSLDNEDAGDGSTGGDGGVDIGDQVFTVSGVLSSLSSTSVGVEVDGHPEPVRCAVPASVNLSGFAVGQAVEMSCRYADGTFVLVKLTPETQGSPGSDGSVDLEGSITVNCAMPAGTDLSGFALGDTVEMECNYSDGRFKLSSLSSDSAELTLG